VATAGPKSVGSARVQACSRVLPRWLGVAGLAVSALYLFNQGGGNVRRDTIESARRALWTTGDREGWR
jgi:hypothetical protein